ncbi:MAG: hypothetical protein ACXWCX_19045, partial [Burkholderiales bacterium]
MRDLDSRDIVGLQVVLADQRERRIECRMAARTRRILLEIGLLLLELYAKAVEHLQRIAFLV